MVMPQVINASEIDRVRRYTPREILRQIDQKIERNVAYYATQADEVIDQRIEERADLVARRGPERPRLDTVVRPRGRQIARRNDFG